MLRRFFKDGICRRSQQFACLPAGAHEYFVLVTVDDRRQFQRLKLSKPILATIDGKNALILDLGVAGGFIEHFGMVRTGQRFHLVFRWRGQDVEFVCEVARSTVVKPPTAGNPQSAVCHTAIRFVEGVGDAENKLQDMMATFIGRILAAQKSNATGDETDTEGALILEGLGAARRLRSQGYVTYRYRDGRWSRRATDSPKQPPDGFTVAAHEDEEELETLCRSFESGDDEARRMIQLVAELSVHSARNS